MGRIWSDENKFRCWLKVEAAASLTLADAGIVPENAARAIADHGKPAVARRISGRVIDVVNWAMVRRFYNRNRSPKQTAAHFDLSLNTVKARIRRESW